MPQNAVRRFAIPAAILALAALLIVLVVVLGSGRDGSAPSSAPASDTGGQSAAASATAHPSDPALDAPGAPAPKDVAVRIDGVERRDADDPMAYGDADAPVVIVVFSDYQCTFCARFSADTLPALKKRADAGELRIEHRDVNVYGDASRLAAQASVAAGDQGKFWQYHDALFAGGTPRGAGDLSRASLVALAEEVGLDVPRFEAALDADATAATVRTQEEQARGLGVGSTPSFLINGTPMVGAQPLPVFTALIDEKLAEARGGQ
ncbi:MAG: thioredoxin domain-containing protein [Dermabacter sp.]|nr:thioredoxin domain-containing protein [Dermabacter sp.]